MTIIAPPQFQIDNSESAYECENVCKEAFAILIDDLAARGWRRKELAVRMADIADEYVLQVASQPGPSTIQPKSQGNRAT